MWYFCEMNITIIQGCKLGSLRKKVLKYCWNNIYSNTCRLWSLWNANPCHVRTIFQCVNCSSDEGTDVSYMRTTLVWKQSCPLKAGITGSGQSVFSEKLGAGGGFKILPDNHDWFNSRQFLGNQKNVCRPGGIFLRWVGHSYQFFVFNKIFANMILTNKNFKIN